MNAAGDRLLSAKIDALLVDTGPHRHERLLAATVLSTRLSSCTRLPTRLTLSLTRLVRSPTRHSPLYLRLAAQLLSRIEDKSTVDELGSALGTVPVQSSRPFTKHDGETLEALRVWLDRQALSKVNEFLNQLWQRYMIYGVQETVEKEQDVSSPDGMMDSVLQGILGETGDPLDGVLARLLVDYTSKLSSAPLYWQPMLDWWLTQGSNNAVRRPWASVLLQTAGHAAMSLPERFVQFLLACVVNTEPNDTLRAQAWATAARLVEERGWGWLLLMPSSSFPSTLGRAARLASLLRFAAGEYHIQLGQLVTSDCATEEQELMVGGTCRLLEQALAYMVQLADVMDQGQEETLSLPGEALLHIRRSLQEALNASTQYIGLAEHRIPAIDDAVVRLFGLLLSEFDVFLQQSDGENQLLVAVRQALRLVSASAAESLLPGLITILASAEGDPTRVELLNDYEILGEPILESMVKFWQQTTSLSFIEAASQLIEIWLDMVKQADVSGLLREIERWIERTLQSAETRSEPEVVARALASAVSSYAMLHGETPPEGRPAAVLQAAVEFCGPHLS